MQEFGFWNLVFCMFLRVHSVLFMTGGRSEHTYSCLEVQPELEVGSFPPCLCMHLVSALITSELDLVHRSVGTTQAGLLEQETRSTVRTSIIQRPTHADSYV